jgi:excisionase family DNA binding protein
MEKSAGAEKAGPENAASCRWPPFLFIERSEQMFQSLGMNQSTTESVTINFTGQITVERETLVKLLRDAAPGPLEAIETRPGGLVNIADGNKPRLAYSVRETAETLGISCGTVYRLLRRGLLRSSLALRNKVIAKTEIERFLKETSKSEW